MPYYWHTDYGMILLRAPRESLNADPDVGRDNLRTDVGVSGYTIKFNKSDLTQIQVQFVPANCPKNVSYILATGEGVRLGKLDHASLKDYFGPDLSPLLLTQPTGMAMRTLLQTKTPKCLEMFGYRLPKWCVWYEEKVEPAAKKKSQPVLWADIT